MIKVPYEDLNTFQIQFKQLISGPAPVGRVLNYVKLIGDKQLKHRNRNRDLTLKDNIGSAWCTEFMSGLGLSKYIEVDGTDVYPIYLTFEGEELYNLIKDSASFNEDSDPNEAKDQLLRHSVLAFEKLKEIFLKSAIYRNLFAYVTNNNIIDINRNEFYDDYFGFFKKHYTNEEYIFNKSSTSATTGSNRVPSLIQFCIFFDLASYSKGNIIFDLTKPDEPFIEITSKVEEDIDKDEKHNEIIIKDLVNRFGIKGVVAQEVITRSSYVQRVFRNNLIVKYQKQCVLCKKDLDDVLIASHIKPASLCNVYEKVDCENGLLLCSLHDKLFDKFLITFNYETGELKYCNYLKNKLAEYQLNDGYILNAKFMTPERKNYLKWHNEKFYKKNGF